MLFLPFSVLIADPKKLLYTGANPARGLLNTEYVLVTEWHAQSYDCAEFSHKLVLKKQPVITR